MGLGDAIGNAASKAAEDLSHPSWKALLLTLPWLIGLIFCVWSYLSDQAIAKRQVTTNGIIRTHEPENHNRFGYEFSVNGKIFTGWQTPVTDFEIGQRVLVYYDPLDAEKNSLEGFADSADRAVELGADLAICIAAFAVYFVIARRVHSRRSSAKT